MTEEDEHEDDEDPCEEEEDDQGDFTFRSPVPEPSSMVGLVCPRSGSWNAGLSFVKTNHKS